MAYTISDIQFSMQEYIRDSMEGHGYNRKVTHPSFLKSQVLNRAAYCGLVPVSAICAVADIALGAVVGCASVCTLGMHQDTNRQASAFLGGSRKLILSPYHLARKTVNPYATSYSSYVNGFGNGLLSNAPIKFFKSQGEEFSSSKSFLKRHVASRLTYALLALSCVVTRVVDAIIGVPAAILSIVLLGKSGTVNNIASRGLQAPALVHDLFCSGMHVLNPSAIV